MIETLLEIMREKGIKRAEMAKMIGISERGFCEKANAHSDFTMTEVEKICMVLGYDLLLVRSGQGWDIDKWRCRENLRRIQRGEDVE